MPDTIPVLSRGSHSAGSGYACAMEHLSWIVGDEWTDVPKTAWTDVAYLVQNVNDSVISLLGTYSDEGGRAYPRPVMEGEIAQRLMNLAWLTVGTADAVKARICAEPGVEPRRAASAKYGLPLHNFIQSLVSQYAHVQKMYRPGDPQLALFADRWMRQAEDVLRELRRKLDLPEKPQSVYPMTTVVTMPEEAHA